MHRNWLLLLVVLAANVVDAAGVSVQLADGRVIKGDLDSRRTDSKRIWIEQRSTNVIVSSSFPRKDVISVSAIPAQTTVADLPNPFVDDDPTAAVSAIAPKKWAKPRVHSIEFEAALANWDQDAELDGILLTIFPLDEHRRILPVNGTAYVSLASWTVEHRQQRVRSVEKWNRRVGPRDSSVHGIAVKLPFKNLRRMRDRYYYNVGQLNVRLSVHGSGSFAANASLPLYKPNLLYESF